MRTPDFRPHAEYVRVWDIPPSCKGILAEKMRIIRAENIPVIKRGKTGKKYDYVRNEDARNLAVLFANIPKPGKENALVSYSDAALVDELRRRGWEVKCSKTTTIEL